MIRVQTSDFAIDREYRALCSDAPGAGAVVFFVGRVRGRDDSNDILALELEHYPGMCERELQALVEETHQRWDCNAVRLIHRVGRLEAGEQIVFVGVASRHRDAAFEAARFLMDQLKTRAPFWKKEYLDHEARWLDARVSDRHAAQRWYADSLSG